MKLQQLRYLCEVVEQRFNVSEASAALHTSQPGVSKQIRLLEQELGVDILVRSGNRIIGMTEAGTDIVHAARRVLVDSRQLEEIAHEFTHQNRGQLTVATTHLHVRYSLLPVIKEFSKKYSNVHLKLLQGAPAEIAARVSTGEADIGMSTGSDELARHCVTLKAYPLYRCVIAPLGHPLLSRKRLTLKDIAAYPLILYDASLSSGSIVRDTFEQAGIRPTVALSAMDADVIKAYVAARVGIAVLQRLAYDSSRDIEIGAIGVDHLFPPSDAKLIVNRAKFLRQYMFDFIQMVAPVWTPNRVRRALIASRRTQ
jgi:LysR family transcriptional regulator, cys regulon transcriptional activator